MWTGVRYERYGLNGRLSRRARVRDEDPQPADDGARAKRSDATRNRANIVTAARDVLAGDGDASMHAIAKAAGVGQGTLYRHFPTREALVMAVHRTDIAGLVDAAPLLLAQHDPVLALRLWLDHLAQYGRIKRGLGSALHTVMHDQLMTEGYAPVLRALAHLLEAGAREDRIRADVTADEVMLLLGFLWRIEADETWSSRVERMLDLVVDGLRPRGSERGHASL
ncbi:TetR/AcrR family transcriptional regulator [Microbacterium enclense]|uniref:TetR/AcrR family transcriptional regulator n=1 Tax=Microbacterium enclense TaxID=993073 RepID=A0A443JB92_9MICO|nr:TetR/AcrR family transcriptional regulator [Microbacterium enclense]RWR17762.1 TetR/AcrR family transcriptional regulator [Microbacterium enclense]